MVGLVLMACTGAADRAPAIQRARLPSRPAIEPSQRDAGPPSRAAPAVRWASDGRVVVGERWLLDPATARYIELAAGRIVLGVRIHTPGSPPANAMAGPLGAVVWGQPGRVCVHVPSAPGQDCFPVPAPSRDQSTRIERELRHRLAGAAAVFWQDARGCVRWTIAPGSERSFVLSRAIGAGQRSYTLRPSGATVALEGPVESARTSSRALGCLDVLDVGEISDRFVEVGGARWFFDEVTCRAGTALFAPSCGP